MTQRKDANLKGWWKKLAAGKDRHFLKIFFSYGKQCVVPGSIPGAGVNFGIIIHHKTQHMYTHPDELKKVFGPGDDETPDTKNEGEAADTNSSAAAE